MKVLVIGDAIIDRYIMGHATRLCPEGPVPVVVPETTKETGGGACLVAKQLDVLIGAENVLTKFGSQSEKTRIFADNRLICRIDKDSYRVDSPIALAEDVEHILAANEVSLIVISDYNKGALTEGSAAKILKAASEKKIPVLVDAKNTFDWYLGAFAFFPNEHEDWSGFGPKTEENIIRKLGAKGCSVNGQILTLEEEHETRDVTGAGDCFLAAFAAQMLKLLQYGYEPNKIDLFLCARSANRVAARSVEFVGTHCVTDVRL